MVGKGKRAADRDCGVGGEPCVCVLAGGSGACEGGSPSHCVVRPMISPAALLILGVSVVATSFLSGIFGMAGGLILIGVCLALLDVAPAMVLHGATQLAANAWRAFLWRRHLVWPILIRYALATTAVFVVMRFFAFIPDKALIYILLGLMPFATELLPQAWKPDIQRQGAPWIAGGVVGFFQVIAGVAGNIVDVFFQNSKLDRRQIVATKSATQAFGHMMRVLYFGSFTEAYSIEIPWWVFVGSIGLAMLGTTLAGKALNSMSEADFRRYSRWLIHTIAVVFLARGVWLLAVG